MLNIVGMLTNIHLTLAFIHPKLSIIHLFLATLTTRGRLVFYKCLTPAKPIRLRKGIFCSRNGTFRVNALKIIKIKEDKNN